MPDTQPDTHTTAPKPRQCRHLKMDGVQCRRFVPHGHPYCYHHDNNRNPSFVKLNGKIRVPLLEDVSSLQVATTAALHALLNKSLDRKEVRTLLYGVNAAASILRLDLAERRWLAQTGQARPEPVTDFAVIGHERVAREDPPVPAASAPGPESVALSSEPCVSLDPEDTFLTPRTIRPFDQKMRIPLPAPGHADPLGPDGKNWPCPYRFNYCKGPGPQASCHYCSGQLRWDDIHPGEPDPGAPGPLPITRLDWLGIPDPPRPAAQPTLSPPPPPLALPAPQLLPPTWQFVPEPDEIWVHGLTPLSDPDPDPVPDPNLLPVLVASADPHIQAGRCYLCPPAESDTSQFDAPVFDIDFSQPARPRCPPAPLVH